MQSLKSEWPDILKISRHCRERYIHYYDYGLLKKEIILAGISDLRQEYRKSRPGNLSHTMLYTIGGQGYLKTPEGKVVLQPGELLLLPAGKYYEFGIDEQSWDICWFHLAQTARWEVLDSMDTTVCQAKWLPWVTQAAEALYHEFRNYESYSESLVGHIVEQIDLYLRRELDIIPTRKNHQANTVLNQLFETVENQLQYPWTVETLAKKAHYSVPHLHSLCKKNFGMGPMKYLTHLRMERAKYLLSHTNTSIASISIRVGYENMFNFSKAFKRLENQSPRDYRKYHQV